MECCQGVPRGRGGRWPLPGRPLLDHAVGMGVVLIVYGTTEGHTDEVVERMKAPMEAAGHVVRAVASPTPPRRRSGTTR